MGSRRHSVPSEHVSLSVCSTVVQVKPPSSIHTLEQPSPSTALPSSQVSPDAVSMLPSPHAVLQATVTPEASRQVGSVVQVLEQPVPSPLNIPFWSALSQDSPVSCMPLPHTAAVQTVPTHEKPGSVRQVLVQPSPLTSFKSSQFS